jgi:3-methylcrotonyl-CoA carboxylase alpha subunit
VADVTVTPVGNGVFRVVDGDRTGLAYVAGAGDERWVFLDGRVYVVGVGRVAKRKKSRDDHSALAAPMPATVVRINVEPGRRVSKGEVLIMLEAMKMELPVKAPRDGLVKSIACKLGELVQPGIPLLELE